MDELPEVFVACRMRLLPCAQYSVGSWEEAELEGIIAIELPEVV